MSNNQEKKIKKIVVWVPMLKTTMEINEKDFNKDYHVRVPN